MKYNTFKLAGAFVLALAITESLLGNRHLTVDKEAV